MARDLPPGIVKTATGFRAFVRVTYGRRQGALKSKRFPKDAAIADMKAWREDQRVFARSKRGPIPARGTFAADIERYLRQVAAMPSLDSRTRDLYAWREALGDLKRDELTPARIREQLQVWRTVGPVRRFIPRTKEWRSYAKPLSASSVNHRRTALLHLYTVLDGKDAPNPVRAIPTFDEPPPSPRARDLSTLERAIARLRNPKMRARASVLLWTGIRGNSELAPMKAQHVDLERAVCHVPTGKGGKRVRPVPLSARGVEAWRGFIAANAWGGYDRGGLLKSILRACRREGLTGVKTYDLRHSISTAYLNAGADLADVQELLGHTTPRMTRRYAPFHPAKLITAGRALDALVDGPDVAKVTELPPKVTSRTKKSRSVTRSDATSADSARTLRARRPAKVASVSAGKPGSERDSR